MKKVVIKLKFDRNELKEIMNELGIPFNRENWFTFRTALENHVSFCASDLQIFKEYLNDSLVRDEHDFILKKETE